MKVIIKISIPLFVMTGVLALLPSGCKKTEDNSVTDLDGNIYTTVTIGTQVWMVENLKTTKYHNGDLIGTTNPQNMNISGVADPKYQWAYDGDEGNVDAYGRLYTWYAATDSRNICPTGWHVPSDDEWTTLGINLGGQNVAGGKLKESGTTHWNTPNSEASNLSGFTGLPGGFRGHTGIYYDMHEWGNWWSSTTYDQLQAWLRWLYSDDGILGRGYYGKKEAMSIRCIKD